jgi:hypothetical protein
MFTSLARPLDLGSKSLLSNNKPTKQLVVLSLALSWVLLILARSYV